MLHKKKFIRKSTTFERWLEKDPQMTKIWKETSEQGLRPEKYIICGLELLKTPDHLKNLIKQIFHDLKPYFFSLRGHTHPIPHLSGIVYMAYKHYDSKLKREEVVKIFGTNIDVVTKAYKEIESVYLTKKLSENSVKVKCTRCFEQMYLDGDFWICDFCSNQNYAYKLSKEFLNVNGGLINFKNIN